MSVSTVFMMWLIRVLTHPGLHPTKLAMTFILAGAMEVSYRMGQKSRSTERI